MMDLLFKEIPEVNFSVKLEIQELGMTAEGCKLVSAYLSDRLVGKVLMTWENAVPRDSIFASGKALLAHNLLKVSDLEDLIPGCVQMVDDNALNFDNLAPTWKVTEAVAKIVLMMIPSAQTEQVKARFVDNKLLRELNTTVW